MKKKYFLVLDVGTSGIKSLIFTDTLKVVGRSHKSIKRFYPLPKFVEQDPLELIKESIFVLKEVVKKNKISPEEISALGITNQRETTILWDKNTGKPVYNAIVWEDERTIKECKFLEEYSKLVRKKTGLKILPYFSATKILWILKNVPKAKEILKENSLLFGTVDSWILWNLSKGKNHYTDFTNASRTLLFNNKNLKWDEELLKIFSIPYSILPKVFNSQHKFGLLEKNILGMEIPIWTVCGDQQSSLYGVGVEKGDTKITYGTGTFIMQAMGNNFKVYKDYFTTIIPRKNSFSYALEAKIDNSGKNVQNNIKKIEKLEKVMDTIAEDAALAIKDLPVKPNFIVVDGGITRDDYIIKKQEEILGIKVKKNKIFDGTAYGTAKLLRDT
jgi:glycerol kinase